MSRGGGISLIFADGEYSFRLPWGQLTELQEICDAGPYVILERLQNRTFRLCEVRDTIRLGLIGGGLDAQKAVRLVRTYVEDTERYSLLASSLVATAVILAALLPPGDDPAGEEGAANLAGTESTPSPMES